jgi:hypothetical protein
MVPSFYSEYSLCWSRVPALALSTITRQTSKPGARVPTGFRPMTLKERIKDREIALRSWKPDQEGNPKYTFEIILNTILTRLTINIRWTFSRVLWLAVLCVCLPVMADEQGGWQFDSLASAPAPTTSDGQKVYEVLLKMLDRWNAHDIEGYLEVYWKSPELLLVIDSEQFNGWQQLHDSYMNGYPDRNSMGYINPARIQVKLLKPDLALALTWWSISFPNSKQKVVGNTTMNLQKFDDGWKVVAAHSSTAEM